MQVFVGQYTIVTSFSSPIPCTCTMMVNCTTDYCIFLFQSTSNSTQSDSDYELAQTLMRQEQQAAMVEDYKIASRLQNEYNTSNAPLIRPPKPPPPPPFTYLPQLPIRPTTKQLLLSQLSTLGRYRKLKPVRTVEKRGVRIGI